MIGEDSLQGSEEEDMIPEPESFKNEFVMGEDLGVTIAEFRSEVSSRISPDMLHSTPVLQFLLEEGEDVFVPKAWTGINGVQPVKLEFLAEVPTRLKPPSRKIPAAIFEASKREFQRLKTYFYRESRPRC